MPGALVRRRPANGGVLASVAHEMRLASAEETRGPVLLVLSTIVDAFIRGSTERGRAALATFSNVESEVLPVFESGAADAQFLGVVSRQNVLDAYYEFTK